MATVTVTVKHPATIVRLDQLKVGQYARVVDQRYNGRYVGLVLLCIQNETKEDHDEPEGRAANLGGEHTWFWRNEVLGSHDLGCPLLVEVLPPGTLIEIVV